MKIKKVLAGILAVATIVGSMSFPVLAQTASATQAETNSQMKLNNDFFEVAYHWQDDGYTADALTFTLLNVGEVKTGMTVNLYHDDELLSVTTAQQKRLNQTYPVLSVAIVLGGQTEISGSWKTEIKSEWSMKKLPNKAIINIDGKETTLSLPTLIELNNLKKFDVMAHEMVVKVTYSNNASDVFASIEDAVASIKNNNSATIELLDDVNGNGVVIPSNRNITINLNGHTFTIDGNAVGSKGTEHNGMQLLKDSNITFKNGTIKTVSDQISILIQNYSNLTLENVTLDGSKLVYKTPYTLSNNNGNILINNSTIKGANSGYAFDVCDYSSYPGATVTVQNSTIDGFVQISNNNGGDMNSSLKVGTNTYKDLGDYVQLDDGTFKKVTIYTLTFENNGGEATYSNTIRVAGGIDFDLSAYAPTKSKYRFKGWYSDAELTTAVDKVNLTDDMTVYAMWKKKKSSSGGSGTSVPRPTAKPVASTEPTVEPTTEPTVEPTTEPTVEPTTQPSVEDTDTITLTIGQTTVNIFGEETENDVAPIISNDHTMLPARLVAEALGATVEWDGENQIVTIKGQNLKTGEDVTIVITINSNTATVNGEVVELESPAFIENERTYTPLRFVAENLGATVDWDAESQTVKISK